MTLIHRHRWLAPLLLLAPGLAWLAIFFLVPLGFLAYQSLQSGTFEQGYSFTWEFSNYRDAITGYDEQLVRSFFYAGLATVAAGVTISLGRFSYAPMPDRADLLNPDRYPIQTAFDVLGRRVSRAEADRLDGTEAGRKELSAGSGAVAIARGMRIMMWSLPRTDSTDSASASDCTSCHSSSR